MTTSCLQRAELLTVDLSREIEYRSGKLKAVYQWTILKLPVCFSVSTAVHTFFIGHVAQVVVAVHTVSINSSSLGRTVFTMAHKLSLPCSRLTLANCRTFHKTNHADVTLVRILRLPLRLMVFGQYKPTLDVRLSLPRLEPEPLGCYQTR